METELLERILEFRQLSDEDKDESIVEPDDDDALDDDEGDDDVDGDDKDKDKDEELGAGSDGVPMEE